ncbi:hypothetical protein HY484_01795 [Candidatus Woesearchaeota archaeon]|nr:hypothetical protein [Candidatus Woesearchaeota archaeon]
MKKISVLTTIIVLLLPLIVFAQENQETPITADLPQYSRSTTIDIRGTAGVNETVELFIKDIKRRETKTNNEGQFFFNSVHLPETNNEIKLKTTTAESMLNNVQQDTAMVQTYNVTVDLEVPRLKVLNFSSLATQPTLNIPIEINKPATINYTTTGGEEQTIALEQGGRTTITLQLQEGQNEITITATDKAGHITKYTNRTTLDTVQPQIYETNLAQISSTYIPDIVIKGVLNKKATVFLYLNDEKKPAEYTISKDDGTFEIPVVLKRDIKVTTSKKRAEIETGEGWKNKIKIEAVDIAGRKSAPVSADVVYSLCGFGSWFDVKISKPTPDKLTPRFILEGIQEVGLLFNATYKGTNKIRIGQIVATNAQLSPEIEGDYDNGLTDVSLITQASPKSILGYLQVLFRPFTFDEQMTTYDKEKNISMHRASARGPKGGTGTALTGQYKNCLTPGVGCMKLFLEITIPFDEEIPKQIVDPRTQRTVPKVQLEKRVQKTCVPIEMMMDIPVPPAKIPKNFLRAAIKFLDKTTDAMDAVLEPLTTVGNYVLYSCMASTAWLYIDEVRETWNCDVQEVLGAIQEGAGQEKARFDKKIAQAGLCDAAYTGKDKEKARENCKSCQKSIETTKEFQYEILQPICDRVACPSAPTLQTHIKEANELEAIEGVPPAPDWERFKIGGKFYAGNDCAFNEYQKELALKQIKTTYESKPYGIKELYQFTKTGQDQESNIQKEDCKKHVRPAHPACCGVSYMQEWETACGPVPLGETFDELQESTCLAAQNVNKKTEDKDLNCGGITNAVAGLCDPDDGGEPIDPIPTGIKYTTKPADAWSEQVHIFVVPDKTTQGARYKIYSGFIIQGAVWSKKPEYQRKGSIGIILPSVNAQLQPVPQKDLTEHFQQEQKEGKKVMGYTDQFRNALCAGTDIDQPSCTRQRAEEIYEQIYSKIGTSDKYYIVKPDQEGIVRSIQCVCLPAVTSYLQFWRNILGVTRDCFKTILLTGDGSEGVCKATLSTYVCDLLFDVVKCFVQKFNTPGYGARPSGGISGFIGTITGAGSKVQQKIQGRYGETALWKTMFVDKKLVHSICAFAFTGTWNFDVSTVFSQTVQTIPVQSQGFLYPCKRQFVSFNPNTNPKGQTTWVYRFGVGLAAGSDVTYDLQLKCSQGYRCQEKDGYKNGECDCNKKAEQTRTLLVPELQPNPLKKNDILNKEIFYTIQAGDPDSNVRYDKAVLKYTYLDPKNNKEQTEETTCDISLTGGDAPAFCQFDTFSLSYRCQFGVGESVVRLDKVEPKYVKQKDGVKMFGLNEPLLLDLHIRQQQPIEKARSFEGKKYVFYTLKDGNRIIKKPTEQEVALARDLTLDPKDGTYTHELKLLETIEQTHFKATGTTARYRQYILKGPFEPTKKREDTDMVTTFDLSEKAIKIPYVLVFDDTGIMDIYTTSSELPGGKTGKFSTQGRQLLADQPIQANTQTKYSITLPTTTGTPEVYTITITLTEIPTNAEIIVIPQELNTTDPCKDPKTPTQWRAEIEIHDADRNGRPTTQVSVDPGTGDQARKEVMVNVVCEETTTLTNIADAVPGTPTSDGTPSGMPVKVINETDIKKLNEGDAIQVRLADEELYRYQKTNPTKWVKYLLDEYGKKTQHSSEFEETSTEFTTMLNNLKNKKFVVLPKNQQPIMAEFTTPTPPPPGSGSFGAGQP